jgi:hypothetical protein
VLARDKECVQWPAPHPQSFVPRPTGPHRPAPSGAARLDAGHDVGHEAPLEAGQGGALRRGQGVQERPILRTLLETRLLVGILVGVTAGFRCSDMRAVVRLFPQAASI